jgi:hypothetical protein
VFFPNLYIYICILYTVYIHLCVIPWKYIPIYPSHDLLGFTWFHSVDEVAVPEGLEALRGWISESFVVEAHNNKRRIGECCGEVGDVFCTFIF